MKTLPGTDDTFTRTQRPPMSAHATSMAPNNDNQRTSVSQPGRSASKDKGHRSGLCQQTLKKNQLRVWSTSLFLAIQGIMARSCAPTTSIWCSDVKRRRAVMLG